MTDGLKCILSGDRSITVFPVEGNSYDFIFVNKNVETRIRLSAEAVQAIHTLWIELHSMGPAA